MSWTYTYHRFADKAAFLAACEAIGIPQDEAGELLVPTGTALDVIGTMYSDPILLKDGTVLVAPIPQPGFHVNAAWSDGMPEAFKASEIHPATPSRVFA